MSNGQTHGESDNAISRPITATSIPDVDLVERLRTGLQHAEKAIAKRAPNPHTAALLNAALRGKTAAKRVVWLQRAANSWSDALREAAACREGCAHCCHIAVAMTDIEAQLLGTKLGIRPKSVPDAPVTAVAVEQDGALPGSPAIDAGYASPCPFLMGARCVIYEHRPMACRTHINLDIDDFLCQLRPGRIVRVPYANATVLKAAYVGLQPAARWADIRAFFPNGLTQS